MRNRGWQLHTHTQWSCDKINGELKRNKCNLFNLIFLFGAAHPQPLCRLLPRPFSLKRAGRGMNAMTDTPGLSSGWFPETNRAISTASSFAWTTGTWPSVETCTQAVDAPGHLVILTASTSPSCNSLLVHDHNTDTVSTGLIGSFTLIVISVIRAGLCVPGLQQQQKKNGFKPLNLLWCTANRELKCNCLLSSVRKS